MSTADPKASTRHPDKLNGSLLRTLPGAVTLHEVGPREGLQSQSSILATTDKLKFIEALSETGLSRIETTGFFHPVKFPQLADASEVSRLGTRKNGIRYAVHIPNQEGLRRAQEAGANSVIICLAASDETARREDDDCSSTEDCLTNKLQWLAKDAHGAGMWVRIFVTNCWGCPYEGSIPHERVRKICLTLLKFGVDEICLADNLGAATPRDVDRLLGVLHKSVPVNKLAVHFHDNRGMAIANVLTAIAAGVSIVDTAVAGLGGHANCKYVPRNPVMTPTEDVVFMLNGLGVKTGVDVDKVRAAGLQAAKLLGVTPAGRYCQAGPVERVK
jgi:isopropylmalate/homocitrate/citramalate synthase